MDTPITITNEGDEVEDVMRENNPFDDGSPFDAHRPRPWMQFENSVPKEERVRGTRGTAIVACFADIQPEPISWLWEGRIALGKLTLIAGDPGLGKSLLTATLAAHVSKGYSWP